MDIAEKVEAQMKDRIRKLNEQLSTIRTGRANPQVLEPIKVEYYGQFVPIKQVAAVSVPEARTLEIRPWDPSAVEAIEKAIQKSDLGIMPQKGDKLLRLNFPAMTEDRRKDLCKAIGKIGEEYRVSVRGERHAGMEGLKEKVKKEHLPEDQKKALEVQIQKLTDQYVKQVDEIVAAKQKEITTV
ncbi:MAG: ribosome recycling factor [Elusimicrobiota bacterium]